MTLRRVVHHVHAAEVRAAEKFYADIFGMKVLMDAGHIVFYGADGTGPIQLAVSSSGGAGAPSPDITIEVDDLDQVLSNCRRDGIALEYGPSDESWGVRRFYIRDPHGTLINVMTHTER